MVEFLKSLRTADPMLMTIAIGSLVSSCFSRSECVASVSHANHPP
jgi:hypothetical protein